MSRASETPLFTAPDYKKKDELWLTEPDTLRRLVGVLGISLPWLLLLTLWWDSDYATPLESISHYYFTRVSVVFTTTVSLMAVFLLIYKGTQKEFWVSTLAGIGALLLVLFPTNNIADKILIGAADCCAGCPTSPEAQYTVSFLRNSDGRMWFHYGASGLFFGSLACMAAFLFTYTKKEIASADNNRAARRMRLRNIIYRTCGLLMMLAILFVLFGDKIVGEAAYNKYHLTFWMETMAIESFGFSWLLRGDMVLKDKNK